MSPNCSLLKFKLIFALLCVYLLAFNCAHANAFEIKSLSEETKIHIKDSNVWHKGCPISLDRMKLIKFSFYDFEGKEHHDGEIVVLDAVAKRTLHIFRELYNLKFPIAKARPIEHYKGNDEASMNENNTSCFNCREITGGGQPSIHAYGLAIDINPIQNPFISFEEKGVCSTKILPSAGKEYMNRTNLRAGMSEKIVDLFKKNGFVVWGGTWNTPIDWQHFQTPRALAQLLSIMSVKDAEDFFEMYAGTSSKIFDGVKLPNNKFLELYQKSPKKFMDVFHKNKAHIFSMDTEAVSNLIGSEH